MHRLINALVFQIPDRISSLVCKSEISSIKPSSIVAQPGLCQIWSEPKESIFPGPKVIFFMLNSAEHEIQNAHKYQNSENKWNFNV